MISPSKRHDPEDLGVMLEKTSLPPASTDIVSLSRMLEAISRLRLSFRKYDAPLRPLLDLLSLSKSDPAKITTDILLAGIISYPAHTPAVGRLVDRLSESGHLDHMLEQVRAEVLPSLVTRLRLASTEIIASTLQVLLCLVRAHQELLGLVLSEADYILPALQDAYSKLSDDLHDPRASLAAKNDALLFCHELLTSVHGQAQSMEALKKLMGDGAGSSRRVLVEGDLRGDYEAIFECGDGLADEELAVLESIRAEDLAQDPRVMPIINLFPHLPAHLVLEALQHPTFVVHPPTLNPEEAAAPLIDAILIGPSALPQELGLRDAIEHGHEDSQSAAVEDVNGHVAKPYERRNVWDDEKLDMSRLRLANDDSELLNMGNTIPDHLRESIMRLVETQAEEAEEEARALREAHGFDDDQDGEDGEPQTEGKKLGVAGDGEESGDEVEGDKVVPRLSSESKTYDVDQQTKLELAYLSDPKVFDRDAGTRRSQARKTLREITGMDDSQLEGWKVMLDRNPHKDAILSRHMFAPPKDYLSKNGSTSSGQGAANPRGDPRGRGKSGGSRGRGRGGGRGGGGDHGSGGGGDRQGQREPGSGDGRGGQGGQGGSGGRGRGGGSKSSRGQSNAARTRGHDKKMQRMGAGL